MDCHGVAASILLLSYHRPEFDSGVIDWLHHSDNRGGHSANHKLLPDMHLRASVLPVATCHDTSACLRCQLGICKL